MSSWYIAALAGSLLGFLVFNFNPASIFMGDSGSLFIGFLLGAASIGGSLGKPGHLVSVVAIPGLILMVPILDTAFVTVMRKVFRRPVSKGGTDHSSHRLVALGFSERRAVLILYFFAAAGGSLALAHYYLSFHIFFTLILLFVIIVGLLWLYLAKVRVYPEEEKPLVYENENLTPLWLEITYRRRLFEVMLDFVLISAAYYISYLLRFEGPGYTANFRIFLKSLPIIIAAKYTCFSLVGVYRGFWRYTGIPEIVTYLKAVTLGSVVSVLLILLAYRFISFSRAVFIIDWFLLFVFVAGTRLSFRIIGESAKRSGAREGLPIIIYGAGDKGELTLREILNNPNLPLSPVGFVDDDPRKQKKRIRGFPVLGSFGALASLIEKHDAKEIILAVTGMKPEREAEVEKLCHDMGVTLKRTHFYIE
jgi:UDP-GlcNAc:undecaprenyl-phosphate GlcNAc-1-phosphate transferase